MGSSSVTPKGVSEDSTMGGTVSVNGDVFRWSWMWTRLAEWFGLEAAPFTGEIRPLEMQTADDATRWADLARTHGPVEPDLWRLASPWHTDADLGRPVEVLTDMSRKLTVTGSLKWRRRLLGAVPIRH